MRSKKGERRNNPANFNFVKKKKKKDETTRKTPWLNIPIPLFQMFAKESNSQASSFPIISSIFSRIDLHKENETSLHGKFPFP